jgi:hypothetical protein
MDMIVSGSRIKSLGLMVVGGTEKILDMLY